VVVIAFFLSGATGLVLESLWTRMLRHVFGSTTLAISTVLTAFMGGLALGSFLFGRYADRIKKPLLVYAVAEIIVGVYALLVPFIVQDLYPSVNAWMWGQFETSYTWLSVLRFFLSALVLILPSTMMGATLPLLARHFVSRPEGMKKIGLNIGFLYTLNTMGAIAGTFLSGFVSLPWLGQRSTNFIAASFAISLGITIILLRKRLLSERERSDSLTEREGLLSILMGIFILLFAATTTVVCWGFNRPWLITIQLLLFLTGGALALKGIVSSQTTPWGKKRKRRPSTLSPVVSIFPVSRAARTATLVTFFFSGVASMNYQVIWSRALAMVIGSSVYSFTIILLAFLIGIAIGSALYSAWLSRIRNPVLHLGFVKLYVGLMAVLNFIVMDDLPFWFARLVVRNIEHYHLHIGVVQFFMFCIAALVIIPVTIGMGAGFPLTMKIATSSHERIGRDVGSIYAINTVGCIIGSFCSAFIFVPGLSWLTYEHLTELTHGYGLQYSLYLSLFMNFSMAFTLLILSPKRPEMKPIKYIVAPLIPAWFIAVVTFAPGWNVSHMTLGSFRLSLNEAATDSNDFVEPDMVFYFDGMSTTVSVERWGHHIALKNNGKVDASNGEDMSTQIMVTGYPLLFHQSGPDDLNVAIVGFGSGTSVGTATRFPVEKIDIIELEPAISGPPSGEGDTESERSDSRRLRSAARFFRDVNNDPWSDHRVTIINNDGRNYLSSTTKRYDVIISEPSNPWITGVSDLFTIDHFRASSQALAPQGIFCQWVQLYELSPENIQAVLRAIATVFPHMIVFAAENLSSDTVILASYDPIVLDVESISRAMSTEEASVELERAGVRSPFDVMSRVIFASREEVLAYSSQSFLEGRRCRWGTENQSMTHLEPIGRHHEGVCVGPGALGRCENDTDCNVSGVNCLAGPPMGICSDLVSFCQSDGDCRSRGEHQADQRCLACAVELNTDDNARIEFNAPRDLIGFKLFEGYVSTFYNHDWPYGNVCVDPGDRNQCLLRGMGQGDVASESFANYALSLIGAGRENEARRFIDHSNRIGESSRARVAAKVFELLFSEENEPVPRFSPPELPPSLSNELGEQVLSIYREVVDDVEEQRWTSAINNISRIPELVRRSSGPDMIFLTAYLGFKVASTNDATPRLIRESTRTLEYLVESENEYTSAHPEIHYFLSRCHRLSYELEEARISMENYVTAIGSEVQ